MPYWFIVTRSFRIAWDHKYLWLLAFFAGESGGSFSYSQSTRNTFITKPGPGTPRGAAENVSTWLAQNVGLLVALGIISLLLVIALFVLAAICEGALIRASAEHDAERPFRLGSALTSGVRTMWVIIRFRLLLIALALPAIAILAAAIVGAVFAGLSNHVALLVVLVLVAILFGLAAIVYFIYLNFLDRLGARTAILEQQGAVASVARAHRLLFKRLGRALLVWLLSIAVGFVVGIALAIVFLILVVPIGIAGLVASTGGPGILWLFVAFGVLVFLVVALPVSAFVAAQASTYWTLAFRRMDLDWTGYAPMPPVAQA